MTALERPAQLRAVREDDIVGAIATLLGGGRIRAVRIGIGDDAAVWQPSRSHRSVITTDMLVEGVHFAQHLMSLNDAGWRSMSANVSDVAAMGARPVLATVALGVPETAGVDDVLELYDGLSQAARAATIAIVGGDLSRAPVWTVAIAATGEVRPSNLKTRGGGGPGCVLCVTGALGAARAGLDAARGAVALSDAQAKRALDAFRRPQARVAEGRFFGADRAVAAMMDLSDGLSTDVARLARASGCGANIEDVPVDPSARTAAESLQVDPRRYALAGGEEFELLLAVRARAYRRLAERFERRFGRALHRIGTLRDDPSVEFEGAPLSADGWDHFANVTA
ncbi:MAG TPA: thiamine-phosphate kinase [Candidatus Tumulicola sp.]